MRYGNGGTVILNGTQSYTGPTTIEGTFVATDEVRIAQRLSSGGVSTLLVSTVLEVDSIIDGGENSTLGASSSDASNLIFNGGTLRFTGSGLTDRLFSIGTFGGIIDSVGSGLHFTNVGDNVAFGTGNRTLTLTGNTTGNILEGTLGDPTSNSLSLAKTGSAEWILNGNNSYTGTTTISAGVLRVNGTHTGGGTYTIASGATLGGDGTITGRVNAGTGGILAPASFHRPAHHRQPLAQRRQPQF